MARKLAALSEWRSESKLDHVSRPAWDMIFAELGYEANKPARLKAGGFV